VFRHASVPSSKDGGLTISLNRDRLECVTMRTDAKKTMKNSGCIVETTTQRRRNAIPDSMPLLLHTLPEPAHEEGINQERQLTTTSPKPPFRLPSRIAL
jgi:hypothetical protein